MVMVTFAVRMTETRAWLRAEDEKPAEKERDDGHSGEERTGGLRPPFERRGRETKRATHVCTHACTHTRVHACTHVHARTHAHRARRGSKDTNAEFF